MVEEKFMIRGYGLRKKFQTYQRNSKAFTNIMKSLFPDMPMGIATEKLSKDLYDAITFGKDIGKKYKRMLKNEKK